MDLTTILLKGEVCLRSSVLHKPIPLEVTLSKLVELEIIESMRQNKQENTLQRERENPRENRSSERSLARGFKSIL